MCDAVGILHVSVNHSKGQFTCEAYRGRQKVMVHTGTIDASWASCKKFSPNSLTSQIGRPHALREDVAMALCQQVG